MVEGSQNVGVGVWQEGAVGEEREAKPQNRTVPCPVLFRPSPHHCEEEGSPQPVRASEGPEGGGHVGCPAPSLDADFSILS